MELVNKTRFLVLDAETSGTDTQNDRILTFFMRAKDGDKVVFEQGWVIDPGCEVPEEAAEVHGMDTDWIREHGRKDVAEAIDEIRTALEDYAYSGYVVCGYNHSFDLAILQSEIRRFSWDDLFKYEGVRFLDPCIFSRVFDKYKKGGHQLITVAKRNGIQIEEDRLHAADYDVEVTEKLVPIMLNRAWKELEDERQGMTPDEFITLLQAKQRMWKKEWAEGLTEYFTRTGKTEPDGSKIIVNGKFPY